MCNRDQYKDTKMAITWKQSMVWLGSQERGEMQASTYRCYPPASQDSGKDTQDRVNSTTLGQGGTTAQKITQPYPNTNTSDDLGS